ncbi:MAG: hypothetical protein KC609_02480, partial [Myxococcales bacterium]|nr:hypothetical protein [Myxococcales bacterium]
MLRPLRLQPDNFTPATRTPWGGRKIVGRYKRGLAASWDTSATPIVGESWEISVEPSFPSRVIASDDLVEGGRSAESPRAAADRDRAGATLAERIVLDPVGWLGPDVAAAADGQLTLLVKLLDAADNLSVQVHPRAGDPALASNESGKPEAWVILERDAGAGLYLGFRDGVTRASVEACLASHGDLAQLLNFVPVEPWDVFLIEAGTPHAIGAGVTLFEPQFITPGRVGVTYRFWDWNRRYDEAGGLSDAGRPRALHIEESLRVTEWEAPRGAAFVESCRSRPAEEVDDRGPTRATLVDWRYFRVDRLSGVGRWTLPTPTLTGLTCIAGSVSIETRTGAIELGPGQSGVVPFAAGAIALTLRGEGSPRGAPGGAIVLVSWPGL